MEVIHAKVYELASVNTNWRVKKDDRLVELSEAAGVSRSLSVCLLIKCSDNCTVTPTDRRTRCCALIFEKWKSTQLFHTAATLRLRGIHRLPGVTRRVDRVSAWSLQVDGRRLVLIAHFLQVAPGFERLPPINPLKHSCSSIIVPKVIPSVALGDTVTFGRPIQISRQTDSCHAYKHFKTHCSRAPIACRFCLLLSLVPVWTCMFVRAKSQKLMFWNCWSLVRMCYVIC